MKKILELNIGKLDCASCAVDLELVLEEIDGVSQVRVDEYAGMIRIEGDGYMDDKEIKGKLETMGYKTKN